jgi:hypothetical protein
MKLKNIEYLQVEQLMMLYHETLMLNLMHYYNVQDQQVDRQSLDLMKHEMLE